MKKMMMKKNTTIAVMAFVACLFLVGDVGAQTRREVVKVKGAKILSPLDDWRDISEDYAKQIEKVNLRRFQKRTNKVPFIERKCRFLAVSLVWYSQEWSPGGDNIRMGFYTDIFNSNQNFNIHEDGHSIHENGKHVSELIFIENDAIQYDLTFTGPAAIDSLEIHFFDPGPSQPPTAPNPQSAIRNPQSTCSCPQPPFQGRLGWCPDGSCPTDPTPSFVPDPTHIIIHHTAGTNVSSDWAAVVRSIWDFHVNTNGWDDIGYNWLIDPNGILYEGRGDSRLGAHFCAQNGNTTGICVMGDFTAIEPTPAALESLAEFLAWETCDENIDPLGTSFHNSSGLTLANVSGHRDGCSTSCPGDKFYPLLPNMRQATQENIDTGCEVEALTAPTVLAITSISHDQIGLKWLDNSADETGYVIERSDSVDNNFSPISQLPANATAFSDNGVSSNKTYFYRVRAQQGSTFSDYSNVAVAITSVSSAATQLHDGLLRVSPNPTSGQSVLSIENQWIGRTEVAVFDGLGRMVVPAFYEVKQNRKQVIQLDLGHLPAGLYWVKMVQGTATGWLKVLKN
jgi:hypothetical protein